MISDWLSCAAMPAASPTGWRAHAAPAGRARTARGRVSCITPMLAMRGVARVVARGYAHVSAGAAAERMRRAVQPEMRRFQPRPLGQATAQRLLQRHIGGPAGSSGTSRAAARLRLRQCVAQPGRVRVEHRRHVGRADPALVAVHQRIVVRQTERAGQAAACSRTSFTTSARYGRTRAKSDSRRAPRQTLSQAELARAEA